MAGGVSGAGRVVRNAPQTFARAGDAERWLSAVETDIGRGDWADPDAGLIPLGEYLARWIEERPGLAVRTVELYEGLLRNHLGPQLGDVMLVDLSAARVRTWRKSLLDAGVGPVTVAKAYRLLKAAMNTAVLEDGLLKANPCVIKGASAEKSPERPIATIEQALKAADAIPPRYRLMVLLATFASLRFAEMVGLQRRDFDLVNGVVHIRRQATQTKKGGSCRLIRSRTRASGGSSSRPWWCRRSRRTSTGSLGGRNRRECSSGRRGLGRPGRTFTPSGTRRGWRRASRTCTCTTSGTPATLSPPRPARRCGS